MDKKELVEKIESLPSHASITSFRPYVDKKIVLGLISQLDEHEKVTIPQFVADWYEENKDSFEANLYRFTYNLTSIFDSAKMNEFERWFLTAGTKPFQTLVNMHQFGYEVEEEKRYLVKMKNIDINSAYLKHQLQNNHWYWGTITECGAFSPYHTKKELEANDFGWVFDCDVVEVEEVE